MMFEIIKLAIIIFALTVNSISDVKKRRIFLGIIGILFAGGVLFRIYDKTLVSFDTLYCLIPGVLTILLSFVSKGSVGLGDALMILSLGLYMKANEILSVIMVAVTLAGIVALVCVTVLKKGRKYELPFIPFLYIGFVVVRCII